MGDRHASASACCVHRGSHRCRLVLECCADCLSGLWLARTGPETGMPQLASVLLILVASQHPSSCRASCKYAALSPSVVLMSSAMASELWRITRSIRMSPELHRWRQRLVHHCPSSGQIVIVGMVHAAGRGTRRLAGPVLRLVVLVAGFSTLRIICACASPHGGSVAIF